MNKVEYENIIAFHPGYYIADLIDELGMTQDEFSKRLGVTAKNLSDLINGKAGISAKIAKNLSLMFGTSVSVWLDLQNRYDEKLLEIEALKAQKEAKADLVLIDYEFFLDLGLVDATKDKGQRALNLLKFLKISSFKVFKEKDILVRFGQTAVGGEKEILNSNAWVQTVINIGETSQTKTYDKKKLKALLPQIKETSHDKAAQFSPEFEELLAECGVAFVLLPSLKNSLVNTTVKWLGKDKVVLGMTGRGTQADGFWLSFFHAIKRILEKRITETWVDFTDDYSESGALRASEQQEAYGVQGRHGGVLK